jgi:hypothetical protein
MISKLTCSLLLTCLVALGAIAADTRCYELRVYYAAEGKLDALNSRFREHTLALFTKHGFTNVGYWVPLENPDNKLIYIISSPSKEAHLAAWRAFGADPEWKKVAAETEANGNLVTKVDSIYLVATDFSAEAAPSKADAPRTFELRTYTATEGKMDALLARFRDHTLKLFEKHGMTNIAYWTTANKESNQLIYILAHKSKEAAGESFKNFRTDPTWVEAKKASEANGSLTAKVESLFMSPTDYSELK